MTNPNDPAFPESIVPGPRGFLDSYPGLTKREYFAAMAMQGFNACSDFRSNAPESIAKMAVEQADALIAELSK